MRITAAASATSSKAVNPMGFEVYPLYRPSLTAHAERKFCINMLGCKFVHATPLSRRYASSICMGMSYQEQKARQGVSPYFLFCLMLKDAPGLVQNKSLTHFGRQFEIRLSLLASADIAAKRERRALRK